MDARYKAKHGESVFVRVGIRSIARATISQMFIDIFGQNALSKLSSHQKDFLGIGHLNFPEGLNDIET